MRAIVGNGGSSDILYLKLFDLWSFMLLPGMERYGKLQAKMIWKDKEHFSGISLLINFQFECCSDFINDRFYACCTVPVGNSLGFYRKFWEVHLYVQEKILDRIREGYNLCQFFSQDLPSPSPLNAPQQLWCEACQKKIICSLYI